MLQQHLSLNAFISREYNEIRFECFYDADPTLNQHRVHGSRLLLNLYYDQWLVELFICPNLIRNKKRKTIISQNKVAPKLHSWLQDYADLVT